jgi:hypothetical protein
LIPSLDRPGRKTAGGAAAKAAARNFLVFYQGHLLLAELEVVRRGIFACYLYTMHKTCAFFARGS